MTFRPLLIAVLLAALHAGLATAGEPVVKGSFHTVLILGRECISVPETDVDRRPGTRLEMRPCKNSPGQIFDWNVVTFEIKFHDLCVDALRVGNSPSQPGDPVGLWYCQQRPHQKWFPHHKNESWLDAFNIVGGGSPSSELCLSIADADSRTEGKSVAGAQLTLEKCVGGDNQWLRLYPFPPLNGPSLSQRSNSTALKAFLAENADRMQRPNPPNAPGR